MDNMQEIIQEYYYKICKDYYSSAFLFVFLAVGGSLPLLDIGMFNKHNFYPQINDVILTK